MDLFHVIRKSKFCAGFEITTFTHFKFIFRLQMKFQICEVTKALGSVMKIVKNGNKVVFEEGGSYIQNVKTKNNMWLREHEGVYVLDCVVAPAAEGRRILEMSHQDFTGRVNR